MTSPTNLTEQIAKLREKKSHSSILNTPENSNDRPNPYEKAKASDPMHASRKTAFDYFTQFAYSLGFIALIGQLFLILSLEFI